MAGNTRCDATARPAARPGTVPDWRRLGHGGRTCSNQSTSSETRSARRRRRVRSVETHRLTVTAECLSDSLLYLL